MAADGVGREAGGLEETGVAYGRAKGSDAVDAADEMTEVI